MRSLLCQSYPCAFGQPKGRGDAPRHFTPRLSFRLCFQIVQPQPELHLVTTVRREYHSQTSKCTPHRRVTVEESGPYLIRIYLTGIVGVTVEVGVCNRVQDDHDVVLSPARDTRSHHRPATRRSGYAQSVLPRLQIMDPTDAKAPLCSS